MKCAFINYELIHLSYQTYMYVCMYVCMCSFIYLNFILKTKDYIQPTE